MNDSMDPVDDTGATPVRVTATGGSVTKANPGIDQIHDDGTPHVHNDGHSYITTQVTLETPATEEVTLA